MEFTPIEFDYAIKSTKLVSDNELEKLKLLCEVIGVGFVHLMNKNPNKAYKVTSRKDLMSLPWDKDAKPVKKQYSAAEMKTFAKFLSAVTSNSKVNKKRDRSQVKVR